MLVYASTLPGPFAFQLQLQSRAEEGPDYDHNSKNRYIGEGRRDGNGADDVSGNQEFKAQENCPAQALPIPSVSLAVIEFADKHRSGVDRSDHNGDHSSRVDPVPDRFHGCFEPIHVLVSGEAPGSALSALARETKILWLETRADLAAGRVSIKQRRSKMAKKDVREELIEFLEQKAFDPILNTLADKYHIDADKRVLRDVYRRTQSEKERFRTARE